MTGWLVFVFLSLIYYDGCIWLLADLLVLKTVKLLQTKLLDAGFYLKTTFSQPTIDSQIALFV